MEPGTAGAVDFGEGGVICALCRSPVEVDYSEYRWSCPTEACPNHAGEIVDEQDTPWWATREDDERTADEVTSQHAADIAHAEAIRSAYEAQDWDRFNALIAERIRR